MKQEEKARAYDKAIEKAAALYKASEPMSGCNVIIETLFPELAESKDEKIMKEIAEFIYNTAFKPKDIKKKEKWLAWLEKQGEQKFEMKSAEESLDIDSDTYNKIVDECIYGDDKVEPKFKVGDTIVEKDFDECGYGTIKDIKDGQYIFTDGSWMNIDEQGGWQLVKTSANVEQKPATWSREDEQNLNAALGYIRDEYLSRWLKDAIYNKYEKSAWSEEEERYICQLESMVKERWALAEKAQDEEAIKNMSNLAFFLKTLNPNKKPSDEEMKILLRSEYEKGRADAIAEMQKEWSEEDSYYRNHIIQIIEEINNAPLKRGEDWEAYINWLKSLRPQNTWKPSDEQMMALLYHCSNGSVLTSLYNDLNKLKEE